MFSRLILPNLVFLWIVSNVGVGLAQDLPDDFDYLRLAHPEVAEFLDLSDVQRTDLTKLVAERAGRLAAAPETERPAIVKEYAQKLITIVTPEQKQRLELLPELRKLRFNFGAQQDWGEMLRWFAKQANLSLVMGNPPRGAFNYSDSNEYTPAQAINLLNSILLTKGFTLVRRDKLLILVEIGEGGIPDEILPRLTMTDLEKRGSFEIVKVTFPLGDKPADTVMAEVKPILGSYGKLVLLPQSKQLLITETVGKIAAIDLLIQSIPSAPAPPEPVKPAPPEPMVLESYPVGQLDFATTVENITQIAPGAIVSGGTVSQKFIVYATASHQTLIKSLLDQLNSGSAPADVASRLQIYSLEGKFDPKILQEQVLLLAPQAKVAVDLAGQRLLVFAAEPQQQLIAEALKKLDGFTTGEPGRQVQLFSLKRTKSATAITMINAISPKAFASADETSGTLLVRSSAEEMEIIREMIQQLEGQTLLQDSLQLKSFEIRQPLPAEMLATLQTLDRHPELRDQYFAHYTRVVLLSQSDDPSLAELGRAAADRLGLAFEHVHVGLDPFASAVRAGIDSAVR